MNYTVCPLGGGAWQLNTPLGTGRNVSSFQISSDSSRVVYAADQDTAGVI